MSGSGRYAIGYHALAHCERCSIKTLRRRLMYDGQYPDLLVCSSCWDPKHPQESLPPVFDPVTLYDPTGDQDRLQANELTISWPRINFSVPFPLELSPTLNASNVVNNTVTT